MVFGRIGKLNNRSQQALVESSQQLAHATAPRQVLPHREIAIEQQVADYTDQSSVQRQPHVRNSDDSELPVNADLSRATQAKHLSLQPPSARQETSGYDPRLWNEQHLQIGQSSSSSLAQGGLDTQPVDRASDPPRQPPLIASPIEPKRSTRRLIKNILSGSQSLNRGGTTSSDFGSAKSTISRRPSQRTSRLPSLSTQAIEQSQIEPQSLRQGPQSSTVGPGSAQDVSYDSHQYTSQQVVPNTAVSPLPEEGSFQGHRGYESDGITVAAAGQDHTACPPPAQTLLRPGQARHNSGTSQRSTRGTVRSNDSDQVETLSQLSQDSLYADSRSLNIPSAYHLAATGAAALTQDPVQISITPISQYSGHDQGLYLDPGRRPSAASQVMAPQPVGPSVRKSQDTDKSSRTHTDSSTESQQSYRQNQQSAGIMSAVPASQQQSAPGNGTYRSSGAQDRQMDDGKDGGRSTPQPGEDSDKAFKDLVSKYKHVKRLYFDGRSIVDQLSGQVEHLQNAIANQRMSQSRTALDDSEYMTRFNRLNGAINNLAFNIRKDWTSLPFWLAEHVTQDGLRTGKQEMTAVGRAVITHWVVEEVFHQCFHPGLPPELSRQLKEIEHKIRRNSHTLASREEYEALSTKVTAWRMATLDGLRDELQAGSSAVHRAELTQTAIASLTSMLFSYLVEPPPTGVDASASTIIELAIGIAANIPLESRDVSISYPLPLESFDPRIMELEKSALPPLDARHLSEMDAAPADDVGDKDDASGEKSGAASGTIEKRSKSRAGISTSSPNAPNMLGSAGRQGSVVSISPQQQQLLQAPPDRKSSLAASRKSSVVSGSMPSSVATNTSQHDLAPTGKVRLAGFLAVDVRGRQVLVKAPVWLL